MYFELRNRTGKTVKVNRNLFITLSIDEYIFFLWDLQNVHGLFLDLDKDEVRERYLKTYPKGTDYLNFLYMICDMTSEDNLNNEVVINQMKIMRERKEGIYDFSV